ncbi:MAG: hypothetical protein H7X99_00345 [Saprospiraceae bacterium]|nr:hypothetical protein [Saprospiraceae bacterium]
MSIQKKFTLPDFSKHHVLVVGDVMIDRYISGHVNRISPEAPVPVLEMSVTDNRLGGAANVAINLMSLGAEVTILSIIGDDAEGKTLTEMFEFYPKIKHQLTIIHQRKTTVKTRIMANSQHLMRIDSEDCQDIGEQDENLIKQNFVHILESGRIDAIVFQDYNKGLMTETLITQMLNKCRQLAIPTFVDPKDKNFFAYKSCTLFKPNKKEILKAFSSHTTDFDEIDKLLREKLHHQITFVTLGSDGIYINDGKQSKIFGTKPRIIADVCGAGDTVISITCLCYLEGVPIEKMAEIANTAGGQVCEHPGVVSINRRELENELSQTEPMA